MNHEGLEKEELEKPVARHDGHAPSGRPVSPCILLCRIEPESRLCQGCARSLDEIARWATMGEAEKESVWQRLAFRRR